MSWALYHLYQHLDAKLYAYNFVFHAPFSFLYFKNVCTYKASECICTFVPDDHQSKRQKFGVCYSASLILR
jgi:hypothetical protein